MLSRLQNFFKARSDASSDNHLADIGEPRDTATIKRFNIDPRIMVMRDGDLRNLNRPSLNRICDISDWKLYGDICGIMRELNEGTYIHRKTWEFAYCIYGLNKFQAVKPDSCAIAIGAGHERPLYYFANRIKKMVATDLYENWGVEGDPDMCANPEKFAPFPYRKEHLEVYRMNGTNLKFADNTYDFAFCLSSIEHFGSRDNVKKAINEMNRVLKPNGILCLTTELILNKTPHTDFFTLDEINKYFVGADNFKLVGGDIDLRISSSLVSNPIDMLVDDLNVCPHIVLTVNGVLFTSVILFLQKTGQ